MRSTWLTRVGNGAAMGLALALVGCASGGLSAQGTDHLSIAERPDALIQMRRSGCADRACPVYSVAIYMDGTVLYDGLANVGVVGQRKGKVSPETVTQLISALDNMDFIDTPQTCCLCPDVAQREVVVVDYRPGSAQKTLTHDVRCQSAPPAVRALEQQIDAATVTAHWASADMAATVAANGL
jgi:hypothetical protein